MPVQRKKSAAFVVLTLAGFGALSLLPESTQSAPSAPAPTPAATTLTTRTGASAHAASAATRTQGVDAHRATAGAYIDGQVMVTLAAGTDA